MKYPFGTLIDKDNMQGILDSFCEAVGIASAIIDLAGIVIVRSNWQRICTDFHRANKKTCGRCIESDTELANQLDGTGKHAFYRCKNGLTDAAVPIILKGEHVANLFVGQFFLEKPDIAFFREQAEKFDFDEAEYIRAVDEVPIIPEEKLSPILNYLSQFAQTLAEIGLKETRRREAESALIDNEKEKEKLESQLRIMIDSCPAWMACLDTDGNYLIANNYYTETFHIPLSQVEGHNFKEFFPPDLYDRHKQLIAQSFAIGKSLKWEDQHMFEDDRITYLYGVYTPLYDKTGSLWGVSAFVQDVTKLKQAEKDLKESEGNYWTLFENNASLTYLTDSNGNILMANVRGAEFMGLSQEEIIGKSFFELRLDHADIYRNILDKILSTGETLQFETKYPTLEVDKWLVVTASPFTIGKKTRLQIVAHDITVRKQAEEALRESEEKYRNLFHYSNDGIYVHDLEGKIIEVNQKALEQIGMTRDEILSSRITDLLPPGLHGKADQLFQEISQKGFISLEFFGNKKSGELFPVEFSSSLLDFEGEKLVQSVVRDISERKKLEEELLKVQKLESTGILAGGIAHDFNNLLMGILGNISLAKLYAQTNNQVLEKLNDAEKASARAQDLTQQLLTFSKGGEPIRKPAVISGLLGDSISFTLSGSNVKSNLSISDKLWPVMIDEGQISQVIQNVIKNADQAMPDGGTVTIHAENKTLSTKDALPLNDGKYVKITITDRGGGILKKHIAKVFDPYFSTKKEGSGLGLASAYSIIKNHSGFITVDSQKGKGTTFHIYLPTSEETPPLPKRSEEKPLSGGGKILLMDDEETVVQVAVDMLNFIGYTAEATKDGSEVIALYKKARRENKPFDAVMLDLTIPGGMGGKETIRKLLKIDPDVKAIVSSGYANDSIMADFSNFGFSGVVAKPYTIQKLSDVLRNVLGGTIVPLISQDSKGHRSLRIKIKNQKKY